MRLLNSLLTMSNKLKKGKTIAMDIFNVCFTSAVLILFIPLKLKGEDGRWILHGNFCYYFPHENDEVNAAGARGKCTDLGSGVDLLSIQTEEESTFIMDNKGNIAGAWMGLITDNGCNSCSDEEESDACMRCRNRWHWYDGRRYSYQNWEPNKPDDGDHKCGRLFYNGQWRNAACNTANRWPSICKRKDPCSSSPCVNGICSTQCANGEYTCTCESGYTGRRCQNSIDDCQQGACNQQGECIDGQNSFICQCQSGYTGEHCETDINECLPNTCNRRGECIDRVNSFTCLCNTGYTGEQCETDINYCLDHMCLNDATCLDGLTSFSCECPIGFTGNRCETDIDECGKESRKDFCIHGVCTNVDGSYICSCYDNYHGDRCDWRLDDSSAEKTLDNCFALYIAISVSVTLLVAFIVAFAVVLHKLLRRSRVSKEIDSNDARDCYNMSSIQSHDPPFEPEECQANSQYQTLGEKQDIHTTYAHLDVYEN